MTPAPSRPRHPLFEIAEELLIAPGRSPFHARGVLYDRILRSAAAAPGGVPALLEQIRDERVRAFADQTFRWSEWYDALPMVPIQAALCRLHRNGDFETQVRRRARAAAEALVPKVFQVVLRLGSPKAAATHVPRLFAYYYDFYDGDVTSQEESGHGTLRGVPRIIAPGFVNTVLGLIEGGLHLLGARSIVGEYTDVTPGEPRHGFETIDCRISHRWVKRASVRISASGDA